MFDIKKQINETLSNMKKEISLLNTSLNLVVICVDTDYNKASFIKQIKKISNYLSINVVFSIFDKINNNALIDYIDKLNNDNKVFGIIILSPIPSFLDEDKIRSKINPKKDIEGLSRGSGQYIPCTVLGIISLIEYNNISIEDKNIVILNNSPRIGKPLYKYFSKKSANVKILNSKCSNRSGIFSDADIIISAIGRGNMYSSNLFKENSIVIDFGMLYKNGVLESDIIHNKDDKITYISCFDKIGSLTVLSLFKNLLISYYSQVK